MARTSNLNSALQIHLASLEKESETKVNKALKLFLECDDGMKTTVLYATGFSGVVTIENITNHFDTLDLMDQLDHAIGEMEWDIENS